MKSDKPVKVAMAIVGAFLVLIGVVTLVIAVVGNLTNGRAAVAAMACAYLVAATPCFAYLYSRRLAKVLGVCLLLALAGAMLWLSFRPSNPAPNPTIYQVAAIALCVLLVARVGLNLRRKPR